MKSYEVYTDLCIDHGMKSYQLYTTICMEYGMISYQVYSTQYNCTGVRLKTLKENKYHIRNVVKTKTSM